jgi:4-amino-4-deoxy-L-arabinose transferase-like glycosyltransferase
MKRKFNEAALILLGFIFLKFILQYLLINPAYQLHRDEYLHLDQANHLAAGYLSVPPFTSWLALFIKCLGNGFFWVKFFPALFGALTIVVAWQMVKELGGGLYAKTLVAIAITCSSILRLNILFQPNSFDVLSWTLVYYLLILFYKYNNGKYLLWLGICFAIGLLNKYNILFLGAALLPAILITNGKKLLTNKYSYIALFVITLLLLPNFLWQVHNDFPVIHHMKELAATQLVHVDRSKFLIGQILFFIAPFFVIIAAFISFFRYKDFQPFRFVLYSFIIAIALFTYFKAKDYYSAGLYPVLLAFGSVFLEISTFKSKYKNAFRTLTFLIIIILFVIPLPIVYPVSSPQELSQKTERMKRYGVLKWEDGKEHQLPQDFADMLGWRELAQKIDAVYNTVAKENNTIVICDNYGEAGAINYYSRKNIHAVSYSADYINWFNFDAAYTNAIYVKESGEEVSADVKNSFTSINAVDSVQDKMAREYGTTIFVLKNANSSFNDLLKQKIKRSRVSNL